jgi:hypothetical protein
MFYSRDGYVMYCCSVSVIVMLLAFFSVLVSLHCAACNSSECFV